MISKLKPRIEPALFKILRPIQFINPNILTIMGLIFPFLFLYSILTNNYASALIFIILTIFDTLDGTVARASGKVTKFGGVLDSTLDRISDALYICAFGFANLVDWWIVISLIITSFTISYVRSRAELSGDTKFKLNIGIIERPERIFFLIAATGFLLFNKIKLVNSTLLLLLFLSIFTVFQRILTAYEKLN